MSQLHYLTIGLLLATIVYTNTDFITESIKLGQSAKTWHPVKSSSDSPFQGKTHEQLKALCGAKNLSLSEIQELSESGKVSLGGINKLRITKDELPKNFDARTKWGNCIGYVRDQGQCGSCWAFATAEVMSDRFCIHSQGEVNVDISAQELTSCDHLISFGCNGGVPLFGLMYMRWHGLVDNKCYPYVSGNTESSEKCLYKESSCPSGEGNPKLYYVDPWSVKLIIRVRDWIKREIMENGPVTASFMVYDDFYSYAGGVYTHESGRFDGLHAIKILGWGHDPYQQLDYWLCQNSWGPAWGDMGFFKIGFGECGIDWLIAYAMPKLG